METKNLQKLFSTEERVRILEHVLYDGNLNTNVISRKISVNKGLISKYLSMLVSFGMVEKKAGSYKPKPNSFVCRSIKTLMNSIKLSNIKPFDKSIIGIGVYGSYANGTNIPESDIDILIYASGQLDEGKVAEFEYRVSKKMKNPVNVLVLYPARIKKLANEDKEFFYSVASGSIVLWGEGLGH